MKDYIGEGDLCIDATAGNGGDTEFLCRMVGEADGSVPLIFRMRRWNIRRTAGESGLAERAVLIRGWGMNGWGYYVKEEVAAIMFNFGYLPERIMRSRQKQNESGGDPVRYGIVESRRRDESLHLQRRRHRIRGADCAAWVF